MRIRRNWTSSRETPEFCVTRALEQLELRKRAAAAAAAAKIDTPRVVVLELSVPMKKRKTQQQTLSIEVDELQLDAAAILSSLDNDSPDSSSHDREIKIRDFVLANGGNARSGGSENHDSATRSSQCGSESDTAHATGSRKRKIAEQQQQHVYNGEEPKPASTFSEKMNSDSSSKEIESAQPEVVDDHLLPQPTTTTTAVVNSKGVVGSRKRGRRQVKSDSSLVQKETVSTKSEEEDYKCAAASRKEKEGLQTSPPPSSFPKGWSYRGLAVIAENEKANESLRKQCGRTDGRSWRCPLKVHEDSTLCEHHLAKFRLKKLKKGVKKQQPSSKQQQETTPSSPSTTPSSPPSPPQIGISSLEHPQVRRRYKTVKLSVL